MPFRFTLLPAVFLLSAMLVATHAQAQSAFGGEIISFNTFGEGLSVTRAKASSVEGTVSNMFFYNRADEPWFGNVWYEYDWELRATFSDNGWSQIRVRPPGEESLISAPRALGIAGGTTTELLHYILIRKDNRYVYDVRRDFNVETYNYNNAGEHSGNSASLLLDGPRVFSTDDNPDNDIPDHIPPWQELDFSLGVTAFGNLWSGPFPEGDFDGLMQVDFTRFYTYTGDELNTTPQWSDEFIGTTLDFGTWQVADWSFQETQFRLENIQVQDGSLFLRVNRGGSIYWDPPALPTPVVTQSFESNSSDTTSPDTFADTNTDTDAVPNENTNVVVADVEAANFEVSSATILDNTIETQSGGGAFGWIYLLLLGGVLPLQRRLTAIS